MASGSTACRRRRRDSALALLAWIVTAAPAFAQEPEAEPFSAVLDVLPDARPAVRVGIAELLVPQTAGPRDEARIAAVTFPRLLYESLAAIDERDRDGEEQRAYAARRLSEAMRDAAVRLSSAVTARDRLLFDRAVDDERRESADEAVTLARELLAVLEATDPADIPTDATRSLAFWDGHDEGRLLAVPGRSDDDAATAAGAPRTDELIALTESEDLDLVLWGTVEEIEGYLAIDLFLFHRFLEASAAAGGTVARPEDVGLEAPVVARESAGALLGRPYARLEVVADDPDASITVNGKLRGFGEAVAPYLRPGRHELYVEAEGSRPVHREVDLQPDETVVERVELEPLSARAVRLQSSPAGANVYADSVWVGRTPLEHRFPAAPTVVRLRRDGYLESRFVVDADSPAVVTRALLPATIDWSEELRQERDDFYRALTWFVVSLPFTVVLNGGYESVRGAFPPDGTGTLTDAERARLARLGNIFYWSSVGSTLVNVGLFINLAITVFDYVEVGEGPHNQ
jgi:hypothetical protein